MRRRRSELPALATLVLLLLAALACAQESDRPRVTEIGMTVGDLDRSVAFFVEVLDFTAVGEQECEGESAETLEGVFGVHLRRARLRLGSEHLLLTQFLAPEGRPMPGDSRGNDLWFQHAAIVVSDMDRAYQRLRSQRVRHASPSPQTLPAWNPAAGGIRAFYFKDPDGHFLELLQFPADKGERRWQQRDTLFLGIDHTAIVVRDTESSLRFWRDGLGLRVAGTSINHGIEQERLNNVAGARLLITTLRGGSGPGVELLEYLAPGGGRPRPPDAAANDLLHWQVVVEAADPAERAADLEHHGGSSLSPGTVRDPDGHAVRLRASAAGR